MECLNDKYFLFHQFCICHLNINNEVVTPDEYVIIDINHVHIKVTYPGGPSGELKRTLRFKRDIKSSYQTIIYLEFYISIDQIIYMDYKINNWIDEKFVDLGKVKDFKQKHLRWKLINA